MESQAPPSQEAEHAHSDSEHGPPSGRTLAEPDTGPTPRGEKKWSRRDAVSQSMKQQVFHWRPSLSNIRKWNVISQTQARKTNYPSPTNVGAFGEHAAQANSPPTLQGLHATGHGAEPSSDFESRRQQDQRVVSTSHSAGAADKNTSEDPMSLRFITDADRPESVQEETQDLRQVKRGARQINTINRRARQRASRVGPRSTLPRPSHDSFVSKRDGSSLQVFEKQLRPEVSSTTMIGPTLGYGAASVGTSLGHSLWDPFHTGKVSITPHMERVLSHYFTVILPAVEPMRAESEEFKSWAIPLINAKPAMLYAILGSLGQDMEESSLPALRSPLRSNIVAEYRLRALQIINECLADTQMAMDPSTLTAIHYLLWQEARVHYMAMLKIWSSVLTELSYRYSLAMRTFSWMAFKDCYSSEGDFMGCNGKPWKALWCTSSLCRGLPV